MLLKKYQVESYTFAEFRAIQEKESRLQELNKLDKFIGHLKRNKSKYMLAVLLIALSVDFSTISAFADTVDLSSLDKVGNTFLDLIRKVGYWVALLLCSKDVIKHCMRGHMESIGTIIALWSMAFGTLYFLPWIFNLIKTIFPQ